MVECPNCNRFYNDDFDFCPYCGTKKPSPKICPHCVIETYAPFSFCPKCGTELISEIEYDKEIEKVNDLVNKGDYDGALAKCDELIYQKNYNESVKNNIIYNIERHMRELEETRNELLKLKKYFESVDIEEYNDDEKEAIGKALEDIDFRLKSEEYNELDSFHINYAKGIVHEKEIEKRKIEEEKRKKEYEENLRKKIIKEGKIKIREINKQLPEVQNRTEWYKKEQYQNLLKEKKELLEQMGIMEKIEDKVMREIEQKEKEKKHEKKVCPECSHSLNEVDEKCPYCGYILDQDKEEKSTKYELKRIVDDTNLNIFSNRDLKMQINRGVISYESHLRREIQKKEKEEKINNEIEKWVEKIDVDQIEALLLNKDVSEIRKEKENRLCEITEKIEKCKKLEKYEEAIEYIDEAIEFNPFNVIFWKDKSFCLFKLSRHREAIECLDRIIKLNPSNGDAWYYKSKLLVKMGYRNHALICLDKAIELNPSKKIYLREKTIQKRGI